MTLRHRKRRVRILNKIKKLNEDEDSNDDPSKQKKI